MAKEKEKVRKSRGLDLDDVPPITEGRRFDAGIESYSFSENSHAQIRLIGKVYQLKMHWVPTIKKDGSRGQFPKLCLHNAEEGGECPYCRMGLSTNTRYLSNAIIRDLEEARPKKAKYSKKAKFKTPGDDNWTPVRVVSFPASVMQKILNFKSLSKVKMKGGGIKTFHVSDLKYGRDLNVKLDSSGTGSGMYDVQREAISRLEGEELEYLTYDIDSVYDCIESEEDALAVIRSLYERGTLEGAKSKDGKALVNMTAVMDLLGVKGKKKRRDEDEDDEDEDDDVPRSKKSKSSKKKSRHDDEDEDEDMEDDDLEDEDEDEDEDERPRKKSKSKSSKKKSRRDEEDEDDDDLDDDDEDEDEDEEPRKKSKSSKSKKSSKSSKKSRHDDDEDEDDDLDDEDEDEEEDERPSKKSKSSKSKKSSKKARRDEEDEDEDDDDLDDLDDEDEDDEEEDERPSKKSKSKKSKASSKKKSSRDDDEDEDEDDDDLDDLDDEDEEDEDEEPRKKSKKAPKKSSKKR